MAEERKIARYDMLELALYHAFKVDQEERHKQVLKILEELVDLMRDKLERERDEYVRPYGY